MSYLDTITDGTARAMDHTSWPDWSVSNVFRSSTAWVSAEVVSNNGVSPVTVTSSDTLPTVSVRSTRTVTSALTMMPFTAAGRKPGNSPLTLYVLGTSLVNR